MLTWDKIPQLLGGCFGGWCLEAHDQLDAECCADPFERIERRRDAAVLDAGDRLLGSAGELPERRVLYE